MKRSACLLAMVLGASGAVAQQYPAKPVKIIVAFSPGGSTDLLARAVGQKLGERWGVPVVVENRVGASGMIGADAVAKSAPDGYTLLLTSMGGQAAGPALYKKLNYDP
ncbi:MAG TPA: tripartite tricarboxylate transporter substrate-binding protein, partial [Burkholderiales bacterium]